MVEVLAAGLHPRVRSQANGSHYTSSGELPLVPGIDAVVRDAEGNLLYTVLDDTTQGTMAERTVIDIKRSVVLPQAIDPVLLAAAMNPAMSSWVALTRRIDFRRGQSVLVLGATGNAGRMAIQVAKLLGAAQVIAAGRDTARLAQLLALGGARRDLAPSTSWRRPPTSTSSSTTCGASRRLARWSTCSGRGRTAASRSVGSRWARSLVRRRRCHRRRCARPDWSSWVAVLAPFLGETSARELPRLVSAVLQGAFDVRARAVPLAQVEQAWSANRRRRTHRARALTTPFLDARDWGS